MNVSASVEPKVSVIIPVYNTEKYLRQCLDSVVCQTLGEIEIICVDDGSTDSSIDILREYKAKDSRIRILTQKNQFAGIARNNGIDSACSKYVAFLDSDDLYLPKTIETLYNAAEREHSDVVKGRFYHLNSEDNSTSKTIYSENISESGPTGRAISFTDYPKYLLSVADVPWNALYRREFLISNNIQFNNLRCSNDHSFHVNCVICADRITVITDYIAYYRIGNPESLIGKRAKYFDCQLENYRIVRKMCDTLPENLFEAVMVKEYDLLFDWYSKLYDRIPDKNTVDESLSQIVAADLSRLPKHFGSKLRYRRLYKYFAGVTNDPKQLNKILASLNNSASPCSSPGKPSFTIKMSNKIRAFITSVRTHGLRNTIERVKFFLKEYYIR